MLKEGSASDLERVYRQQLASGKTVPKATFDAMLKVSRDISKALAAAVLKWDPSEHPRDETGQFSETEGEGGDRGPTTHMPHVASGASLKGQDRKLYEQGVHAGRGLYGRNLVVHEAAVERGSLDEYLGGSETRTYDTWDYVFDPYTGKGREAADRSINVKRDAARDGKIYVAGANGVFVIDPKATTAAIAPFGARPTRHTAADVAALPTRAKGAADTKAAMNTAYHYVRSQGFKPVKNAYAARSLGAIEIGTGKDHHAMYFLSSGREPQAVLSGARFQRLGVKENVPVPVNQLPGLLSRAKLSKK